jgi:hypothetical protein
MAGHWVKGGVGGVAAAAGVAMPTESTATESIANKMPGGFSFNFAPRKTGKKEELCKSLPYSVLEAWLSSSR